MNYLFRKNGNGQFILQRNLSQRLAFQYQKCA